MAFMIGLSLIAIIFISDKLIYRSKCVYTTGTVTGLNYSYGRNTRYITPVVTFMADSQKVIFYAEENLDYTIDDKVPVMYLKSGPRSARVYTVMGFWLKGWPWCLLPLIVLAAFSYSVLDTGEFAEVDLRKMSVRKISKE
jgi:hypothetical protein